MAKLTPVNSNPFESKASSGLTPVGYNPFEGNTVKARPVENGSSFMGNTLRGAGERALDLGGNLLEFLGGAAKGGERWLSEKTGINPYIKFGDDGVSFEAKASPDETGNPLGDVGRRLSEDTSTGYTPRFTWEGFKGDPSAKNLAGYIVEQGVHSTPDMAAALLTLPAYITSRTQEIAEERVRNDDRVDVGAKDLGAAAVPAVASALLERIGARGVTKVGGVNGVKDIGKEAGKAALKEGATEFVQENIEYAGETVGTKTPYDLATGLDRGVAGAVAGSGLGGGVRAGTATLESAGLLRPRSQDSTPQDNAETLEQNYQQAATNLESLYSEAVANGDTGLADAIVSRSKDLRDEYVSRRKALDPTFVGDIDPLAQAQEKFNQSTNVDEMNQAAREVLQATNFTPLEDPLQSTPFSPIKSSLTTPNQEAIDTLSQVQPQQDDVQSRLEAARQQAVDPATAFQGDMRRAAVDRAMRAIESRDGVAAPEEAALLEESGIGRPFDRIDESLAIPEKRPSGPRKIWTGGQPEGYRTINGAKLARINRERQEPEFQWTVEPMANGNFAVAGYDLAQETEFTPDAGIMEPEGRDNDQVQQLQATGMVQGASETPAPAVPQTGPQGLSEGIGNEANRNAGDLSPVRDTGSGLEGQVAPSGEADMGARSIQRPGGQPVPGQAAGAGANQSAVTAPVGEATTLRGEKIDAEYTAFSPDSGTLNVSRAEMPQVKAEHRGALANFLKGRGIAGEEKTVPAATLKPTQREFSEAKVQTAKDRKGGDRAILVSSDGHILDGHHQWMARRDQGEDVRVIQLGAPIRQLLEDIKEFPSVEQAADARQGSGAIRLKSNGSPFATETSAKASLPFRRNPGAQVVPVEGGFGVQLSAQSSQEVAPSEQISQPATEIQGTAELTTNEKIAVAQEKARNTKIKKNRVNPDTDSLAVAVAKNGGISKSYMDDMGFDKNVHLGGGRWLFSPNGTSPDDMAMLVAQDGYLTEPEMASNTDTGGVNTLYQLLSDEIAGTSTRFVPESAAARAQMLEKQLAEEEAHAESLQAGREAEYEAIAAESGEEAASLARVYDDWLDQQSDVYEQEIEQYEQAISGRDERLSAEAARDDQIREGEREGQRDQGEAGRAQEEDGFGLEQETEESRRARESQERTTEREQARAERQAKREADREREQAATRQAVDQSVDRFELGQDTDQQLSGQDKLFSRAPRPIRNPHTPEELRTELDNAIEKGVYSALESAGLARIITSDQVPDNVDSADSFSSQGRVLAYVQNGQVTFIADNIPKGHNVKGLMLHEIGVHLKQMGQSDQEFAAIKKRTEFARKAKNEKVVAAFDRVPDDTEPHLVTEEAIGYLVENAPETSLAQQVMTWIKAKLKEWVRTLAKGRDLLALTRWANNITEDEAVMLATAGVKSANADTIAQNDGVMASMAEEYGGQHRPMTDEGGAARLHDLEPAFGEDIYGPNALQYYGSGDARERAVVRILKSLKGNPDAEVTIYRGGPETIDGINSGDWVTLIKSVAQDYADQSGNGKVVKKTVKASEVTSWADSLLEFGYFPESDTEASPDTGDIRYSRAVEDESLATIADRVLAKPERKTVLGKIRKAIDERTENFGVWAKQGIIDEFASIAEMEKSLRGVLLDAKDSAYKAAAFSKNTNTVLETVMHFGAVQYVDGGIEIKENTKGLMEVLEPLAKQDLLREWELWAGAVRAKRLLREGRERNYTADDVAYVLSNVAGEKLALFQQVHKEWTAFNKATLDFAESAGLINPEQRALWERDDYVPFHRVSELEDGNQAEPRGKGGLSGQKSGIKKLEGGVEKISIVESMVKNTAHMIDASMKNVAMRRTLELAKELEVVEEVKDARMTEEEARQRLEAMGIDFDPDSFNIWKSLLEKHDASTGTVSVSENGKTKRYIVHDPLLLSAMSSLGPTGVEGIMKVLRIPKKLLTDMITSDPSFALRNWIRDTLSTWTTVHVGKRNALSGAVKGVIQSYRNHESQVAMMAQGVGGSGFYDTSPEGARAHLDKLAGKGKTITTIGELWQAYRKVLGTTENANRIAVYEAALKSGASKAEAAYQAMDVLNFSRHGEFKAIRIMIQLVPFANARLQGLDRLWRGAKEGTDKWYQFHAQFMVKGSMITAATLALLAANWDEEDYWELEEWERDTYYHFFINGEHYRMPKPFEVGAMFSTIPERLFEQFREDANTKLLGKRMLHMVADTFAMDPTPQFIKPALEVGMNRNTFTGRDILSMGMKFASPEAQYSPYTSKTFIALADAMPDSAPDWMRSPARLEHLFRGYLGTMGGYALMGSDYIARVATDAPKRPEARLRDVPVVSSFVRDGVGTNKHVGRVYDMANAVNEINAAVNKYREEGRREKAQELRMSNKEKLRTRADLNRATRRMSDVSSEMKRIYDHPAMSPEKKRERLDRLIEERNDLAKRISTRYFELF